MNESQPLNPYTLRYLAEFFDLYDQFFLQQTGQDLGNGIQNDLRRWADLLEADDDLRISVENLTEPEVEDIVTSMETESIAETANDVRVITFIVFSPWPFIQNEVDMPLADFFYVDRPEDGPTVPRIATGDGYALIMGDEEVLAVLPNGRLFVMAERDVPDFRKLFGDEDYVR